MNETTTQTTTDATVAERLQQGWRIGVEFSAVMARVAKQDKGYVVVLQNTAEEFRLPRLYPWGDDRVVDVLYDYTPVKRDVREYRTEKQALAALAALDVDAVVRQKLDSAQHSMQLMEEKAAKARKAFAATLRSVGMDVAAQVIE